MKRERKEKLKQYLPAPVLAWHHRQLAWRRDLRFQWAARTWQGDRFTCPICDHSFDRLLPGGEANAVLRKHRVVGAGQRKHCFCPQCHSKERDRFLYLFLKQETALLAQLARVLHIAPERSLKSLFSQRGKMEYIHGDLDAEYSENQLDLTNLPFPEGHFDAVICNHVLEHIPDDAQALAEIRRVLKPHGVALLQVPIALGLEATLEDESITDPSEREQAFGQHDHVRIYGMDFVKRLQAAKLEVHTYVVDELFDAETIRTHMLIRQERLFACFRG